MLPQQVHEHSHYPAAQPADIEQHGTAELATTLQQPLATVFIAQSRTDTQYSHIDQFSVSHMIDAVGTDSSMDAHEIGGEAQGATEDMHAVDADLFVSAIMNSVASVIDSATGTETAAQPVAKFAEANAVTGNNSKVTETAQSANISHINGSSEVIETGAVFSRAIEKAPTHARTGLDTDDQPQTAAGQAVQAEVERKHAINGSQPTHHHTDDDDKHTSVGVGNGLTTPAALNSTAQPAIASDAATAAAPDPMPSVTAAANGNNPVVVASLADAKLAAIQVTPEGIPSVDTAHHDGSVGVPKVLHSGQHGLRDWGIRELTQHLFRVRHWRCHAACCGVFMHGCRSRVLVGVVCGRAL